MSAQTPDGQPSGEGTPDAAEVLTLLIDRLRSVVDVGPGAVTAQTRFVADLHADSLDLLEVVESVEQQLRDRGLQVALPDAELVALTTVGQAAERIAAATSRRRP